jgi:hypothetical protein
MRIPPVASPPAHDEGMPKFAALPAGGWRRAEGSKISVSARFGRVNE